MLKVILSQNYFMFQQKIYQPAQGISMGSLISSLIAEIYLQHYEDVHIKQLLHMKSIALYVRYVDDILVTHNTKINLYTINTYRVLHKSLRDFRTRLRNNQERHGRKEHINMYRISPSFLLY